MNATNIHNLLSSRDTFGGINYVSTFVRADNCATEVYNLVSNASTNGALHFAAAVIIAAEGAGYMSPTDTHDMLDYVCGLMAA